MAAAAVPCVRNTQQIWLCFRGNNVLAIHRRLLSRQYAVAQSHLCLKTRNFSKACITYCADTLPRHDSEVRPESPAPKAIGMSFEEYVKSRQRVRRIKRLAGIPFAFIGMGINSAVSVYMFPNMFDVAPEQVEPILGLDPIMFCGLSGVICCGIGYVIGGAIFGNIWRYFNKDLATKLHERETDFLSRLNRHRFVSVSKFEDDYYGEKIKNLSDYRQWVRTQQKRRRDTEKFEKKNQENKEEKS